MAAPVAVGKGRLRIRIRPRPRVRRYRITDKMKEMDLTGIRLECSPDAMADVLPWAQARGAVLVEERQDLVRGCMRLYRPDRNARQILCLVRERKDE